MTYYKTNDDENGTVESLVSKLSLFHLNRRHMSITTIKLRCYVPAGKTIIELVEKEDKNESISLSICYIA